MNPTRSNHRKTTQGANPWTTLGAAVICLVLMAMPAQGSTKTLANPTADALTAALAAREDHRLEITFDRQPSADVREWFADRLAIRLGNEVGGGVRTIGLFVNAANNRIVFASGERALARIDSFLVASNVATAPLSYTGLRSTFLEDCRDSSGNATAAAKFYRIDGGDYTSLSSANPSCNDIAVTYEAYVSSESDGQ